MQESYGPARSARPVDIGSRHEPVVNPGSLWDRLVAGILRNDAAAECEFAAVYGRGVDALLRRRLGQVGTHQLVQEVLAGAIREIRRGTLRRTRDLVHFLRNVAERERVARAVEQEPHVVHAGVLGQSRIRAKAALVAQVMQGFPPAERAALEAYYVHCKSAPQAAARGGLSESEFAAVRLRLREQAGLLATRRPPAIETCLPEQRAMAASS